MSRKDPAEVKAVALCVWCGGEIYEGSYVMRIDDGAGYVHAGYAESCADEYAKERVYDGEGTVNHYGQISE